MTITKDDRLNDIVICSIDTSSTSLGIAFTNGNGRLLSYFNIKASGDPLERIQRILGAMFHILTEFDAMYNIHYIFIEEAFGRFRQANATLNFVRGAIFTYCKFISNDIQFVNAHTNVVNQANNLDSTIKREDKKPTCINRINTLDGLELTLKDDDIADAVSIGKWYAHELYTRMFMKEIELPHGFLKEEKIFEKECRKIKREQKKRKKTKKGKK